MGVFNVEVEANRGLTPHPRLLRAVHAQWRSQPESPIWVKGVRYGAYGYLLIPYCSNGTLLDLVMKA
jgi:hypothetical protein